MRCRCQWLAKEFTKERSWKLKQAKRAAVAVQRSNLDLESRVLVRQREEEKSIRKRAAWIAKEVGPRPACPRLRCLPAKPPLYGGTACFLPTSHLWLRDAAAVQPPGPAPPRVALGALPTAAATAAFGCGSTPRVCLNNILHVLLLPLRSWASGTRRSGWCCTR